MDNKPIEKCPTCNFRTDLKAGNMEFEGDDNPSTPTIAYEVQYEVCNNKSCKNHGVQLNKIRHRRD